MVKYYHILSNSADNMTDNIVMIGIVFFFQAEDGIRDYKVTGVQTCALPISTETPVALKTLTVAPGIGAPPAMLVTVPDTPPPAARAKSIPDVVVPTVTAIEIGRASCRERV